MFRAVRNIDDVKWYSYENSTKAQKKNGRI
jgi:hypothetical protein